MLDRSRILQLIPHQGPMCLLGSAEYWSADSILCRAASHLDERNPLRHNGRLSAVCGAEYGMQAAALHGALLAGAPRGSGLLAAIRRLDLWVDRLDDPDLGELRVESRMRLRDESGTIYAFRIMSADKETLVTGSATVMFPRDSRALGVQG